MIILAIPYILFAWLIGVAINHAADILPKREAVMQYPACSTCKTALPSQAWSVLVAFFSGYKECESCGQPYRLAIRSVIIELVLPLFFTFILWRYGFSLTMLIISLHTAILVLITVTDLEHRLIFHIVIFPSIVISILLAFVTPGISWRSAIVGGIFAFIVSYLAMFASRGGLGEGDVTLSTYLGFIMGFPYILFSLAAGVFLGGGTALLLLITGRVGMKTFIPYGPFLTITGWIILIWGDELWKYYYY